MSTTESVFVVVTVGRRLIISDIRRDVDHKKLTTYVSSWSLEPRVDANFLAHFNDVVRAETVE